MLKVDFIKLESWTNKVKLLLSRIFNIADHEWRRVMVSWLLKYFLQIGFIISGTLLTALFVEKFGIAQLPKLFILQSISIIAGVLIFSPVAEKLSRKKFIKLSALLSSIILVCIFFVQNIPALFFGFFIFAISVLMIQISIILSLFIEELFTPLESERTFPVVESSEPIGSLTAGIIIVGILGLSIFDVYFLLIVAAIFIGLLIPVLIIFTNSTEKVPRLKSKYTEEENLSKLETLKKGIHLIKIVPFLKMLALLVLCQFIITNILEFQFTKAISAHVDHNDGIASALTHGLGIVHVVISLLLLVMQLFVFGRILNKGGVVKAIMLNPLLSAISFVFLTISYTFTSAVSAKAVFEITGNLFRNAHQVSFFSLKEKVRTQAKEFLEGVSRPLGALIGTSLIILLQIFVDPAYLDIILNTVLILFGCIMLFMIFRLAEKHTLLVRKNLEMRGTSQEKLEAIELLAQKGHKNATEILCKKIASGNDEPEIQVKILKTLGIIGDIGALPEILRCFASPHIIVQLAAVDALSKFKNLGDHFLTQSFARHRVIESLKAMFIKSYSKRIKTAIINTLTNIKDPDFVPFLLEIIKSPDEEIRAEAIYACGLFQDPTVVIFLEKFLFDPSPRVRANTIVALWQFIPLRMKLIIHLTKLLESKDENELMSGLFVLGEIRLKQEKNRLITLLEHINEKIRKHAAIALGKNNHLGSIPYLEQFIWNSKLDSALRIKNQVKLMHEKIQNLLKQRMAQTASRFIIEILSSEGKEHLEDIDNNNLKKLLHIFLIIEAENEVLKIRQEMVRRQN